MEHSLPVVYRVTADTVKLVCLALAGKVSERLRLLKYLPIPLLHPEILLPLKMPGVL